VKVLAGAVALMLVASPTQQAQQTAGQQAVPDAPRPQVSLPAASAISAGVGTTSSSNDDTTAAAAASQPDNAVPGSLPASPQTQAQPDDQQAPDLPALGEGPAYTLHVGVNFVEVPYTVKDRRGNLVPGLTWRDVQVFENGLRQQIALFTVDPWPLSVALIIDQSMTPDYMAKVNNSLSALQGAFAPFDEIAVFTYNNTPKLRTELTGARSARLTFTLENTKTAGREPAQMGGGPMSQTTFINNQQFDPNTSPVRNSQSTWTAPPRERHALNDAILEAAKSLSKVEKGRRRVIYVISDGKEDGSVAKFKDVVRYLQTNKISVYGTLVGDSSLPVIGFLDRIHIPLQMRDNILPAYAAATGGSIDAQFRQKGIEESFAAIAREVRTQYVVGYYSKEPFIDGKFRTIEVRVLRPNLDVLAKKGYFPTAGDASPANIMPAAR